MRDERGDPLKDRTDLHAGHETSFAKKEVRQRDVVTPTAAWFSRTRHLAGIEFPAVT